MARTNSSSSAVYSSETREKDLPELSITPTVHAGCCLGLSSSLVAHLHALLPPPPAVTLSIGSGFGLLEALLLKPPYNVNVIGVDVYPTPNSFLPATHHREVTGTRFLDPLAQHAYAWMFVYPRRVALVDEYLSRYGDREGSVQIIVWIGPTSDWDDYKDCFREWDVDTKVAEEVGGRAWETISVATRKTERSSTGEP